MRTKKRAILLVILSTFFNSAGQIFWKYGVNKIDLTHLLTILNFPFLLGIASYSIGISCLLPALKRGELSVLYPIVATSFLWITLLSYFLFPSDTMNGWKWAGIIIILFSISILGYGGSKKRKHEEQAKRDTS